MHKTELKKGLSKCFPFSVGFTAVSSAKMTRMCPCSAVECSADKTKKEIATSLNEIATTKSTMRAFPTSSAVTMTEETKDSTQEGPGGTQQNHRQGENEGIGRNRRHSGNRGMMETEEIVETD